MRSAFASHNKHVFGNSDILSHTLEMEWKLCEMQVKIMTEGLELRDEKSKLWHTTKSLWLWDQSQNCSTKKT